MLVAFLLIGVHDTTQRNAYSFWLGLDQNGVGRLIQRNEKLNRSLIRVYLIALHRAHLNVQDGKQQKFRLLHRR